MKKILLVLGLSIVCNNSFASYWDCQIDIYKNGFWGWNWETTSTAEIRAESRTQAEAKSLESSGTTRTGAFGSKISFCSKYNHEGCKYRVERAECSRQ